MELLQKQQHLHKCFGLLQCFVRSSPSLWSVLTVSLSAIGGVMLCDYYLIRRGHFRVYDLYKAEKGTWYYYTAGINWRAYVAYFAGIAINMPGFLKAFIPSLNVSIVATRLFQLVSPIKGSQPLTVQSWFTGVIVSSVVYYICCLISPPPGMNKHFEEVDESGYEESTFITHHEEPAGERETSTEVEKADYEKNQTSVHVLSA